jgi:ribosomal protein S9
VGEGDGTGLICPIAPLEVVEQLGNVDIAINVCGGGCRVRLAPSATASAAR